jgi:hypothetical protein
MISLGELKKSREGLDQKLTFPVCKKGGVSAYRSRVILLVRGEGAERIGLK